uniref:Solute carrier family 7 member 3 n=1 Tax=Myotis myotis TaxID=51298 RepID=A0A7J7YGQ7_MYOMY|nr:solute carrier family 7 member 3 [Myotis myotis]
MQSLVPGFPDLVQHISTAMSLWVNSGPSPLAGTSSSPMSLVQPVWPEPGAQLLTT